MTQNKKNFIRGAAILGVAGVIVKIIGAVFRIPLGNWVGDLGISYYQTAYPVYNWLLVVSVIGIPTAISKMISEKDALGDTEGMQRILKVSFWTLSGIGITTMLLLVVLARWICAIVNNPLAVWSMYSIAPALFFVSLMSVFRGYFLGLQKMEPHGISQVIEQFVRVAVGLGLALYLYKSNLAMAAAGATFGATAGSFVGTLYILYCYLQYRKNRPAEDPNNRFTKESYRNILKKLLIIAVPITVGSSVMPIMNIIDLGIVINRLVQIGMDHVAARQLYGQLTGYAATVVNLPMVITGGVQISLVPAVTQFVVLGAKEELDRIIETGIRIGLIVALPCALGLVVFSTQIMHLLYPMQKNVADSAGHILAVLGWGVLGLAMFQALTGILQGLGKPWIPARNLATAACIKLALGYTLVGIPALNIVGAAASTGISFAIAALLNFFSLMHYRKQKLNVQMVLIKPVTATVAMVVAAKGSYFILVHLAGSRIATVLAIVIAGLIYLITLIAIKGFYDEDYDLLPGGRKLKKLAVLLQKKSA